MKITLINPPCEHKTWVLGDYRMNCSECDLGVDLVDRDQPARALILIKGPAREQLPVFRLVSGIAPERHSFE